MFPHVYFPIAMFPPAMYEPASGTSPIYDDLYIAARYRIRQRVPALTNVFYSDALPPNPRLPYGIQTYITSVPEVNISANYWETRRVQYDVVAETLDDAIQYGQEAIQSLSPQLPKLLFRDGYLLGSYVGSILIPNAPDPSTQYGRRFRYVFEFNFIVGQTFPTS